MNKLKLNKNKTKIMEINSEINNAEFENVTYIKYLRFIIDKN